MLDRNMTQRSLARGLTLIELLVALTVGSLVVLMTIHAYSIIKQREQIIRRDQKIDEFLVVSADQLTALFQLVGFETMSAGSDVTQNIVRRDDEWVGGGEQILLPSFDESDSSNTEGRRVRSFVDQASSVLRNILADEFAVPAASSVFASRFVLQGVRLGDVSGSCSDGGRLLTPPIVSPIPWRRACVPRAGSVVASGTTVNDPVQLAIHPTMDDARRVKGFAFVLIGGEATGTGGGRVIRPALRMTPMIQGIPILQLRYRIRTGPGSFRLVGNPTNWEQVDAILLRLGVVVPVPRGEGARMNWFGGTGDRSAVRFREYRISIPRQRDSG